MNNTPYIQHPLGMTSPSFFAPQAPPRSEIDFADYSYNTPTMSSTMNVLAAVQTSVLQGLGNAKNASILSEIVAPPLLNPIDIQRWKQFLTTIPEYVWTSHLETGGHINVAKNKFPTANIVKGTTIKPTSTKQIKSKMDNLSSWDITKMYSLGDPTLPENQGGLSFENICRNIHNSGRTDIKKAHPPLFFHNSDHGNNYSVGFRRIYWYINLSK
jgi:hypothetical protein